VTNPFHDTSISLGLDISDHNPITRLSFFACTAQSNSQHSLLISTK
jgi:hypothetical protein